MIDKARLLKAWKLRIGLPMLRRLKPERDVLANGRLMRVNLKDRVIGSTLYVHGKYEYELDQLLRRLDLHGKVCLDIGANIGLHTLALSECVGNEGQVYAFEPEAYNFSLLSYNLRCHGATNVVARQCAVGDVKASGRLDVNLSNFGDHRIDLHEAADKVMQEIEVTTVDSSLKTLPDDSIGFIKVDVQGYEPQVIRGMTRTLKRNPSAVMMIEVFPEGLRWADSSPTELMQTLLDTGMHGWELHPDRVLPVCQPWAYELILHGREVNVLLSQDHEKLWTALKGMYAYPRTNEK